MDGNDTPVSFGLGDAQRIDRSVMYTEHVQYGRPTPKKQRQNNAEGQCVVGVLTSPMTAASPDGLTGATHFTFKIWRLDPPDSHDPTQMVQDTDDTVGVNRSKRTAAPGDFCMFFYLNGEWNAIPIDCAS